MVATTQNCPGILQVTMDYLQGGEKMSNTFHVDNHTGLAWSRANMDAIAAVFQEWFTAAISHEMSTSLSLIDKTLTDLTSLNGLRVVYSEDTPPQGQEGSDALPYNVAFAVRLVTQARGRGVNGRIFIPGLTESQASGSTMAVGAANSIVTDVNDLISSVAVPVAGAKLSVLSRYAGGVKRAVGIGRDVQFANYADLTTDSQKLRLPNHRRNKRKKPAPTP